MKNPFEKMFQPKVEEVEKKDSQEVKKLYRIGDKIPFRDEETMKTQEWEIKKITEEGFLIETVDEDGRFRDDIVSHKELEEKAFGVNDIVKIKGEPEKRWKVATFDREDQTKVILVKVGEGDSELGGERVNIDDDRIKTVNAKDIVLD